MIESKWMIPSIALLVVVLCCFFWLRLAFRGDLDSGTFEILKSEAASPNRIAMLAERPGTKWSGNTFFVVIGDHLYSANELRRSLYASEIVFEVAEGGLELKWVTPDVLNIVCVSCKISSGAVQVKKFSDKGVTIRYIGFPM